MVEEKDIEEGSNSGFWAERIAIKSLRHIFVRLKVCLYQVWGKIKKKKKKKTNKNGHKLKVHLIRANLSLSLSEIYCKSQMTNCLSERSHLDTGVIGCISV